MVEQHKMIVSNYDKNKGISIEDKLVLIVYIINIDLKIHKNDWDKSIREN